MAQPRVFEYVDTPSRNAIANSNILSPGFRFLHDLIDVSLGNRRKKVDPRRAPRLSQLQAFVVAVETLSKTSPQEAIQVSANKFVATPFFDSLSPFLIFFFQD